MYSSIETLNKILANWKPKCSGSNQVFYYDEIKVFSAWDYSTSERNIYILESSEALKNQALSQAAACIIQHVDAAGESVLPPDFPVIVLTVFSDTPALYQILMQYYYHTCDYLQKTKQKLLHMMSGGSSLQSILTAATRELENPFIVYDNNYSLVSHSVPRTLAIPAAQNVIKNGYANVDIITEMEKSGFLDYVFVNQLQPSLVKIINGYEKLAVSIHSHDTYVGLLCYFNYVRPIHEGDYEIVQFMGELVRIYFQNRLAQDDLWTSWNYVFSTVLNQKNQLEPEILKNLGLKFPKEMTLMVIGMAGPLRNLQGNQLKYLQTRLHRLLPGSHQYFFDGYLICLDHSPAIDPGNTHDSWKSFREELFKLNLVCGMSNLFSDITNLAVAFEQAAAAFVLGQKSFLNKTIYFYQDYMIPHMATLLQKEQPLENLYHPALRSLIRYDQQYSTNYVDFLLIYLLCNRNKTLCAKCFSIHYNSVKYRLNVIQEIGNINLKNSDSFVALHVSCQMYLMKHLDFLKKYSSFLAQSTDE